MVFIQNDNTEPCYNLALEEYILKNTEINCFILWQNRASVIAGKHQNIYKEINYRYIRQNHIALVRRISGGGAVYHDLGNLNFSFILDGSTGQLVDFKKYTQPIIDALKSLSITAYFGGHNSLLVDGLKISGNAEHVYKNRVLHHGTLLFSTDLDALENALASESDIYTDKAVKSVRAAVANISDFIQQPIEICEFKDMMNAELSKHFGAHLHILNRNDLQAIEQLMRTRYQTWEWNFGYSPHYTIRKSLQNIALTVETSVKGGIIENIKFENTGFSPDTFNYVAKLLTGSRHHYEELLSRLQQNKEILSSMNITPEDVLECMF